MIRTGIVRHVDHLGRINLPIELQRTLNISCDSVLEFFVDDEKGQVIIRKYRAEECIFCSSTGQLVYFRGHFICKDCLTEPKPITTKPKRNNKTLLRLAAVMKENPSATQAEWARLIGISQGRVSQLLNQFYKEIK